MKVYGIEGKLNVDWRDDVKAIVDTWSSYGVTLDEFREAVLVKGVDHAKARGVKAWIVDSSTAKGVFSQEIQDFIGSDVFPTFAKIGVKYFITITSESSLTRLTVDRYSAQAGPSGLQLVTVSSADQAVEWLQANA